MSPTLDWFQVLRAILTRNVTVEEQTLHAIVGFDVIRDRLDPKWPIDDPALLCDTNGGDEAHGTLGNVIHPTIEIWSYGSGNVSQDTSASLEEALANVLNGRLGQLTDFGTLMSAVRERPSTSEWDPDQKRPFQRATYRTWFSSISA